MSKPEITLQTLLNLVPEESEMRIAWSEWSVTGNRESIDNMLGSPMAVPVSNIESREGVLWVWLEA